MSLSRIGVIYLVHFTELLAHARHYVGFCEREERLDERFEYHSKGQGSRLIRALVQGGGDFTLVRLWKGTRNDERALKNMKCAPQFCPVCSGRRRRWNGAEELTI